MADKPTYEELERRIADLQEENAKISQYLSEVEESEKPDRLTLKNITDRKRAVDDPRRSDIRYRELVENLNDVIYILDAGGVFNYVSSSVTAVFGYTPGEVLGKPVTDWVHPDDLGEIMEALGDVLTGRTYPSEYRLRAKNDEYRWVRTSSLPVSRDGKVVGLQGVLTDITNQKMAEERLRRSEEDLRRTLDATTDGIWTWNFKTNEFFFSPKYYTMLGYEPGAFPADYDHWVDLIHPDDRKAALAKAEEYLKYKPGIYENEFRLRTSDGGYRWIHARARVVERDESGHALFMIGNHEDITDRKRTEVALRQSESILDQSQVMTGIGSFVWDLRDDSLEWSRNMCAIHGLSKGDFQGNLSEALAQIIHPDDLPHVQSEIEKMVADKMVRPVRFRIIRPDGRERIIRSTGEFVLNDKGDPVTCIGVHRDITNFVRAEKEKDLLLSNYKQKALEMEALFNGTKLLLEDDSFAATARKIFNICRGLTGARSGYVALLNEDGDENEVLFLESGGLACDVSPELPMPIRGLRGEAYKVGQAVYDNDFYNSKWMKYMPAGHVKLDNVLFAPLKDNGGTIGLIGLANKESNFTADDAKIVAALGELAAISLMQNQTREALHESEKRLRQTQKLEAIGNLAGGIAHDFNNILASIIGYTELAIDDLSGSSRAVDNLYEVLTAGKRARDLVKQILTFARQVDTEFKPVQVGVIAREALKLLRSTIPSDIAIKTDIRSESLVFGDAVQMHQVFMNLCTNAAQAMESEGGELFVGLSDVYLNEAFVKRFSGLKVDDYLEIKISDTGDGIPPDRIDHVFDPYFTTKETGRGTGMGLATVHGIIKAYNGEIMVESEVGKGTTFTVYLPVSKKRTKAERHSVRALPSGTERILVIDDEPAIAKMAGAMLWRLGYDATWKTNSLEALELFRSRPGAFDLVITDMTMPHMTGDRLAREMMAIRPDLPVILCTGYSTRVSEEKAAELGIKAFVMKPLGKEDLAKTVRNVLDEARK